MTSVTPQALEQETAAALDTARTLLAQVRGQSGARTADNTLLPFHEIQLVLAQPAHRAGPL